ncbi:MAG: hypothetical protein LVS60_06160 [Nodosilinea sp. LVE1205-7]
MGLIGLTVAMAACYSWRPNPEPSPPPSRPLSDSIAPPPPPAGSFLGQLSPEQTNQLTSLGIEVVVPGVVSPDFKAVDLRVDHRDQALGYMVVYRHRQGQCFAVEFANGDPTPLPPTQSALAIQPPLFGGKVISSTTASLRKLKCRPGFLDLTSIAIGYRVRQGPIGWWVRLILKNCFQP